MMATTSVLVIANCIGAGHAAVLGIALAGSRRPSQSERLLGWLCLSVAVFITGAVLVSTRLPLQFPHLGFLHDPVLFTSAPLLYLYCRVSSSPGQPLRRRDILHFLPALACLCLLLPWFLQPAGHKLAVLERAFQEGLPWYAWRSAAVIGQATVYLALLGRRAFASQSAQPDAARECRRLLMGLMAVALPLGLLRLLAVAGVFSSFHLEQNLLIPLLACLVMSYLVLTAIRRAAVPADRPGRKTPRDAGAADSAVGDLLRHRLWDVMHHERVFLDPDLTLPSLAQRAGVPARTLSEWINREHGQTVSDFINLHRVEEAKRRLLDPQYQHLTVLAIAEDVGFKSKSNFNLLFKKQTSLTPSEFRKSAPETS